MSEKIELDFYAVKYTELAELLSADRTPATQAELERRALDGLKCVFQLYRDTFGGNAAERFSEDAASLFVGNDGGKHD